MAENNPAVVYVDGMTDEQIRERLAKIRCFLLDMDGTLYLGDSLFPGTIKFLWTIRETGGRYIFMSNNSSRGTDAYITRLRRFGILASPEDFLTSADAAVDLLRREQPGKRGFVVGTASFIGQLQIAGFTVSEDNWQEADYLLVGFDRELTYRKLEDTCRLLAAKPDIPYYATNPDWVCPTEFGSVPDCGSICEMLFRASGKRPRFIGKPEPDMILLALEKTGYGKADALMIGDRVYTDVAAGVHAGIDTVLVLSGEGTVADAEQSDEKPTWILPDISFVTRQLS